LVAVIVVSRESTSPSPPNVESPIDETSRADPQALAESPPATTTAEAALATPAPAALTPTHVLRGQLLNFDASEPGLAFVTATAVGGDASGQSLEGPVGRDGAFALDVTVFFASGRPPGALEVSANHPSYLVATARVDAGAGEREGPSTIVHRVQFTLELSKCVRGYVLFDGDSGMTNSGHPVPRTIVAYRMVGNEPLGTEVARAQTEEDGVYRLRIRDAGKCLLVASAPRFRASFDTVDVPATGDVWARAISIPVGETIKGHFTLPNGEVIAGAKITATLIADGSPLGDEFLRIEDRIVVRAVSTTVDYGTGEYRLEGLEPGKWRVSVREIPGAHPSLFDDETYVRVVEAPASGIDFTLSAAVLTIQVSGGDRRVDRAAVTLARNGTSASYSTGWGDEVSVVVVPQTTYQVHVARQGFKASDDRADTPQVGERRTVSITLEPIHAGRGLVVTLCPPPDTAVRTAELRLWTSPVNGEPMARVRADRGATRIAVSDLECGTYWVVVRAAGDRGEAFVDAGRLVSITPDGDCETTLDLAVGGRIRVAAKDRAGHSAVARIRVRDANDRLVEDAFAERPSVFDQKLRGLRSETLERALPAGRYVIDALREGFPTESTTTFVETGRTTDVVLVLSTSR
ncbi:MAG: carboxypeptidase regulatory-like domain-containing protein, partial [Planctomycetes bacterium]|nr:carboxypeptidase regulatory-like domain-containing protein [Planctomycetota bacterium]